MTEPIAPALSPDDWAYWKNARLHPRDMTNSHLGDSVSDYDGYKNARHALAAIALMDQPFGFTHKEVAALRRIIAFCEEKHVGYGGWGQDDADDLVIATPIVQKLAALVPPASEVG